MAKKPKAIYRYSDHYSAPVPAQKAGEELSRIEQKHGAITPKVVVDESRPDDAPLHPVFTWDDQEAAEKYRQREASECIRSVRRVQIDDEGGREIKPAFVSVISPETGHRNYVNAATAMSDEDYRKVVLDDVIALLRGIQKRHRDLAELAGVWEAIEAATAQEAAR